MVVFVCLNLSRLLYVIRGVLKGVLRRNCLRRAQDAHIAAATRQPRVTSNLMLHQFGGVECRLMEFIK